MNILPARAALAPGLTLPFGAINGAAPYSFALLSGDGSIDPATGIYTAPAAVPAASADPIVIQATDAIGNTDEAEVLICTPLELFCDIIQQELGLQDGRVYIYDQKINMPTDYGLFVAVKILNPKPFASKAEFDPVNNAEVQTVNMYVQLSVDIISRGPEARDRKEEVIMALNSFYSQQQQELNSFKIAQIPTGFVPLSDLDGSAIPYRFNITVAIQYFMTKVRPNAPYFDTFQTPAISVDP